MFGHRYYHETTRRYVAIFGTLFNDIVIERKNNAAASVQKMKVPIAYGPMQKFLSKIEGDPNLDRPGAITLPRMSFEISGMTYDGERKVSSIHKKTKAISSDNSKLSYQFAPSPYNLDFELTIMTKYAEDGTKILEQILPFFQPSWTSSVKLIDDLDVYLDIPIVLNSVSTEDVYEGDYETRRSLMWTLNFTLKGYYFGPISQKKVIKFSNIAMYDNPTMTANTELQTVNVRPGLTANGQPATTLTGINATTVANNQNGLITGLIPVNTGSNYTSATVTIDPPNPITATGDVNYHISNHVVESVTITEGGGYYQIAPEVTFSSPTAPSQNASMTAIITDGVITGAVVVESGIYYTGEESVEIIVNTGTPSTLSPTVTNEVLSSISIANTGFGYDSVPSVTVSQPTLAQEDATMTASLTGDIVSSISINESGRYYLTIPEVTIDAPIIDITESDRATGSVDVTGDTLTNFTLVSSGNFYDSVSVDFDQPTLPASSAAAEPVVDSNGVLQSLTITDNGRFYLTPPNITITPNPNGVSFITTLTNGSVTSITISGDQSGFDTSGLSEPSISFDEPEGTPSDFTATGTATITDGVVSSVNLTYGGAGYESSSNPTVTFSFPDTTADSHTATATATISNGKVSAVTVNDNGKYYNSPPNVTVQSPTGLPSDFTATATVTIDGSTKGVDSVTITDSGLGYEVSEISIIVSAPEVLSTETEAQILLVTDNGVVTDIEITNGGSGFDVPPLLVVSQPAGNPSDFAAQGTVVLTDGVVTSVNVDFEGIGYNSQPTVTFEAPYSITATALASVYNNEVIEYSITNQGAGYRTIPNVTVSAPNDVSIPVEQINFDDNWDYVVTIEDP